MQNHLISARRRASLQWLYDWVIKHSDGDTPHPKCTNSDEDIQTIQIHIWLVFVATLQLRKCRYSQDEAGTLFLRQAPQLHRCSVIISTMTVWVYTKCLSGGYLLSGETASLFLCLTHLHYRSQCCCRLLPSVGRERWSLWISEELCIYVLYLWSCYYINHLENHNNKHNFYKPLYGFCKTF